MRERAVRQGLQKAERVRKTKDIDRLFRRGAVTRGPNFRVHRLRREETGGSVRAAFVAGKRIGKSVVRNRIRRLLREAFRRIKADLKTEPIDLVFVAGRDFSGARSAEITDEMRTLLAETGLLAPSSAAPRADRT